MKKDTVIFDLDGTLLDTLEDLADSVNYALGKHGLPGRTYDEVRSFVGNGVRMLIKRSVPTDTDEEKYEEVFSCFREHYLENMYNKTAPYESVKETLDTLKSKGYKIGVVSNKLDEAVKKLCEDFFEGQIHCAQGAKGESDRKPKPDNVFSCIAELGSERERCIYVGDSEVDLLTAQNAGIDCVCVTWGFRTREELIAAGAEALINRPEEIFDFLN